MNCDLHSTRCGDRTGRRLRSLGTTSIELLVAFTLLTTALGASLPMVIRHGRILVSARHYRLALDELSNQLERLTALPPAEVPGELQRLKPSDFTATRLSGAELKGQLQPADIGQRITLQIIWDEPQRRDAPVTLVGWIPPERASSAGAAEGSQP